MDEISTGINRNYCKRIMTCVIKCEIMVIADRPHTFLSRTGGSEMRKQSVIILVFAALLLVIAGIGTVYFSIRGERLAFGGADPDTSGLKAYDDVRKVGGRYVSKDISGLDLRKSGDIIPTLWFNQDTEWPAMMPPGCDPDEILEKAKNPGLGVRKLHEEGITGKGVNVAIIDQPMYLDHPEFEGKVKAYRDFGCGSQSSMHGPAVASLLVGDTIGTAPGADLYFAAVPSWLGDSAYFAQALEWIVEENSKLPENDKIRAVSVSAAPSGNGTPFSINNELWDEAVRKAEEAGIAVLDCTSHHGFVAPCYYNGGDPEEPSSYKGGFPSEKFFNRMPDHIFVPTSPRTTAEEYVKGEYKYQYTGQGGLSWGIPYCTGVMAMGWQINPDLTWEQMIDLLFESAYKANEGTPIIDPPAFIESVKQTVE